MLQDINRNPRRWVDESRRIMVIEGWHPCQPAEVGYNVKVDGDWFGTFESLEGAAHAAAAASGIEDRTVILRPVRPGVAGTAGADLHLVRPLSVKDA